MKLCPHCQTVYHDDDIFFCLSDGNALLENYRRLESEPSSMPTVPHFSGSLPPNSFNPPPTVQMGTPNIQSFGETATKPSFIPPVQLPPASNSNKNVIIAVLATASVFLLIGVIFLTVNNYLISKETENKPVSNSNTREDNSTANLISSNSENIGVANNSGKDKQDNIDDKDKKKVEESNISTPVKKTNDIDRSLPNGISQQYSGSSYFPNKTIPLTLSLKRNGQRLSGSAQTPDDYDDLSGTVQSDGSFYLRGYNAKFGKVTGIWTGKISESGQVSGIWTSTIDGSRVRFSAR